MQMVDGGIFEIESSERFQSTRREKHLSLTNQTKSVFPLKRIFSGYHPLFSEHWNSTQTQISLICAKMSTERIQQSLYIYTKTIQYVEKRALRMKRQHVCIQASWKMWWISTSNGFVVHAVYDGLASKIGYCIATTKITNEIKIRNRHDQLVVSI